MPAQEMPLLDLFLRLQKAGLPLGIDEYQLALRALQAGFGLQDWADLQRLCHTLWVKSAEERRSFDHHFEQMRLQQIARSEKNIQAQEEQSEQAQTPGPSSLSISAIETTSEIIARTKDEIEAAQTIQATGTGYAEPSAHYISPYEYLPVTRRQMKQSWRYLRRPVRQGLPVDLDIEATVQEIGRTGVLLKPVLVPARLNKTELLLLIDHGGSMVPFQMLSQRLIETVYGGRLGKVTIYYFHNCPGKYLYRDPAHREGEAVKKILASRYAPWTGVLVFSDAGAARGGFSSKRIDKVEEFLSAFKRRFRYIAWLNPMPRARWSGTTAGRVERSVAMFELSRQGLDNAISALRGRSVRDKYSRGQSRE
jgi:uncharacterized protein with von Willebrand factor type A (vWA) domain